MIELDNVSKVFVQSPHDQPPKETLAVSELSFRVETGEALALIGTSGCGKTTTLKMINRLVEPSSGCIRLDGVDTASIEATRLRRKMGYVVQNGGLFPHMTVAQNVGLLNQLEGWSRADLRTRVDELLELVNLPPDKFAKRYPRELSGGQQQRVGVARALALDPKIVLMDEPFGALDPITRDQLHQEFLQLKERLKKTLILVTHDLHEAFLLADKVALMDKGRLIQLGTQQDFREAPKHAFVEQFMHKHLTREEPS